MVNPNYVSDCCHKDCEYGWVKGEWTGEMQQTIVCSVCKEPCKMVLKWEINRAKMQECD